MGDKYLIVADVDQIQNYVFGSNQLRAVRGASVNVERLGMIFKTLKEIKDGWDCLRWQGGQMVAIWSGDDSPQTICNEIEAESSKIGGPALTVTTDWTEYSKFRENLDRIFQKIEIRKRSQGKPAENGPLLSGGFTRYCDLCKTYPAQPAEIRQFSHHFGENDNRYLCDSVGH